MPHSPSCIQATVLAVLAALSASSAAAQDVQWLGPPKIISHDSRYDRPNTTTSAPAPVLTPQQIAERQSAQLYQNGLAALNSGNWAAAEKALADAAKLTPRDARIATALAHARAGSANERGLAALKAGDWKTAVAQFQSAAAGWPEAKAIQQNLSDARRKLADVAAATEMQRDAATLGQSLAPAAPTTLDFAGAPNAGAATLPFAGSADPAANAPLAFGDPPVAAKPTLGFGDPDLRDAMADNESKSVFVKKSASKDLLSTAAHGADAAQQAGAIGANDDKTHNLGTAMEEARDDAAKRFDGVRGARNAGEFATVVLHTNAAAERHEAIPVPERVARNPRYQELVKDHAKVDRQLEQKQRELDIVKSKPDYAQNKELLTKAWELGNEVASLKVTKAYDEKQIDQMVHLPAADDFSDEPAAPSAPKSTPPATPK